MTENKPNEVDLVERVTVDEAKLELSSHPTAEEEAAVMRKMDFRIMPLLLLFYTLSVLDRSNLGNARLAGLPKSIDLSGSNYAFLATIFYIGCKLVVFWHDHGCHGRIEKRKEWRRGRKKKKKRERNVANQNI